MGRNSLREYKSHSDSVHFFPGPGVGGHCIPIDPNYLSHRVQTRLGYAFRFVELAQEINVGMPAYVVRRIQDLLNDQSLPLRNSRVLLLGGLIRQTLVTFENHQRRTLQRL